MSASYALLCSLNTPANPSLQLSSYILGTSPDSSHHCVTRAAENFPLCFN